MTLVLGEMDGTRVTHTDLTKVTSVLMAWFVPQQPVAAIQFRGQTLRSVTYPVEDVHQVRIT